MKRIAVIDLAVVLMLIPIMAVNCSSGNGDSKKIEDTIKGYISSYNASNYEECVDCFTGYSGREDAISELTFLRGVSDELTLSSIGEITVEDSMATAEVAYTIAGQNDTQLMSLRKVDGKWKILWERETLTGEWPAIRDTISGYLTAYNAGDFAGCLTYLTDFGDEQEVKDSLALIKEHLGTITFREIDTDSLSSYVNGDVARATVRIAFWWSGDSTAGTSFRKVADVWKLVWTQRDGGSDSLIPGTVQRVVPATVEIASDLDDVLEAKFVRFEGDDGVRASEWETWQVRNTGTETLQGSNMSCTVEYYKEDGSSLGSSGGSFGLSQMKPGDTAGYISYYGSYTLNTVSYIKVTIERN